MLASECIFQAMRESNLISINATPTDNQNSEGLDRLNAVLASVPGYEVGEKLAQWLIGLMGIDGPLYIQNILGWQAPLWKYPLVNSRLVLNQAIAETIYFPLAISDGARMASIRVNGDCVTFPVTLSGNGYTIEGQDHIVLNLNDETVNREWMFRADLGDWVKLSPIDLSDPLPFPAFADDYFVIRLAMRLNPRYGRTLDPQSANALARGENQLQAFYSQRITTPADPATLALSTQVYNTWMGTGMGNYGFGFQPGAYGWMGG